jgi:hypothetical protein
MNCFLTFFVKGVNLTISIETSYDYEGGFSCEPGKGMEELF